MKEQRVEKKKWYYKEMAFCAKMLDCSIAELPDRLFAGTHYESPDHEKYMKDSEIFLVPTGNWELFKILNPIR